MLLTIALVIAVAAAVRGLWSPCGLSMVSSLNPLAERARGHRPGITAVWYVLGAVAGGALFGAIAAVLAAVTHAADLPATATAAVAVAAASICVLSDARVFGRSLPDHPRQVNERWLGRYRRWIYAFGFGAQIGTGFATYIMTAGVYLTAVLAVLTGPSGALLVGITFGTARGLCILVSARATTPDRLRGLLQHIDALDVPSLRVLVAAQVGIAAVAAYGVGGVSVAGGVALVLGAVVLTFGRWDGEVCRVDEPPVSGSTKVNAAAAVTVP